MNIKIVPRLILAVVVIAVCVWQVFPLDQSIRLGKDLRGGVSMVYSVAMPPTGDSQRVLVQVVESLKRRVNPQGVLDISLQPQGLDRIEVVMPLPSPEVRAMGDEFRAQVAALGAQMTISARELDQALAGASAVNLVPAPKTGATVAPASRRLTLDELQRASNDAIAGRADYQAAITANASQADLAAIEERIALAEVKEQSLRARIAESNINEARLTRALALSDLRSKARDEKGRPKAAADGTAETDDSPRELELVRLKALQPDYASEIDALAVLGAKYSAMVTGYDDPEDLKRLLRGAGVLEFHIAVSAAAPEGVNPEELRTQLAERGPGGTDSPVARWFPINDPKQWGESPEEIQTLMANPTDYLKPRDLVAASYDGTPHVLLYVTDLMTLDHLGGRQWSMKNVFQTQDELGRAAVAFQLDPSGGQYMGRLTAVNIGRPMAIVLDGQLFSAPTLQGPITTNGQVTGSFSNDEIQYLIRVLQGGELEAKLHPEPISVSILGPALGKDNLERGLRAVVIAAIATSLLITFYYLGAGLIAVIAIAINLAMIFGIMAGVDGSFTLPGLAGVALVVGMAVDANVLVYERAREELIDHKEPLKTAIDLGFSRAFNAIVDGNVTNLIVCVVLYKTAATEVKGFALTMMIGVLTTLFTALFCTRIMYAILINWCGMRRLPMLPTLFPSMMKVLRPNFDWLRIRWALWAAAAAVGVVCLGLVWSAGREMLETEFRGGVTMTLMTRKAVGGEPTSEGGRLFLSRETVESRIHALGDAATDPTLHELRSANVLTVGETTPDGYATGFQVRVANPANLSSDQTVTEPLVHAVAGAFADSLDAVKPVQFSGAGVSEGSSYTFAVGADTVGQVIGEPAVKDSTRDYLGGVVILLKDLQPPVTIEEAESRIGRMRKQPDFSSQSSRPTQVVGVTPADPANPAKGWTAVAVMVTEPTALLTKVDAATWERVVAVPEWKLIQAAFTSKLSLDQVNSFSPRVAENLAASAIVAVIVSLFGMILYIWLRFSSFRYSVATITAVSFNVLVCLGVLAITLRVAGTEFGKMTLLEEFRIDLNVIAALLTIIGYSLNDTIVILDRIRENKGKLPHASWKNINDAINQTFSRTLLTGGTTLVSAGVLYVYGGPAIAPFAFTFIVGLIAGTISSVVIAAPMTFVRHEDRVAVGLARTGTQGMASPTPA
ncbi:MAG: protein translocase subunit SecD [Phycisphaerales bacterium]|nr:protein translocase subunit SecD [Phycisphaerales bacterium]